MRTLDLQQAAEFLRMSPAVLRQKARQRAIKAAKPGKCWVFLEQDLVSYLDRLYSGGRQAPHSGSNQEKSEWGYLSEAVSGGSTSPRPVANEYATLLGLPMSDRRRNTTTG
jgi:hypothetical protein